MGETALEHRRFELKYRIHYRDYLRIRSTVRMYMRKDAYTQRAGGKGYLVRSLYFDSHDYRAYHEKMSGNSQRVKLRIRSYARGAEEAMPIKAELKIRAGNLVVKHSEGVTLAEYRAFARSGHWGRADPALEAFEAHLHGLLERPKVLIEYLREGYETRTGEDLRITFDHDVRSAHSRELFPGHAFFRTHHPQEVVMEIKFKKGLPAWVRHLVHQHGLKIVANSKFTQGIQAARNDLHHPGGIVVIR